MTQTLKTILLSVFVSTCALGASGIAKADESAALQALAEGSHRAPGHAERNEYRHPVETLAWFGIQPDMTVVEITPGGSGWYTEILAPYLKDHGTFVAANYNPNSEVEYFKTNAKRFADKLAADPDNYGKVKYTLFEPPRDWDLGAKESADLVVTFRNTHNWMRNDSAEPVYAAALEVLKPGGILGVVQHRGDPEEAQDPTAQSGYVRQDLMVEMIEKAGFKLVDSSEINANPKDTKTHPEGVWNLPPVLRGGEKDKEKYLAIGESDRMTLKFVKPE